MPELGINLISQSQLNKNYYSKVKRYYQLLHYAYEIVIKEYLKLFDAN